ncbi:MAG: sensor histidine kinase [Cytophagaceae bacterium]
MYRTIKEILRDRIRSGIAQPEGLHMWREKIFKSLMVVLIILGFIAYIPSIILSIYSKYWSIAILDTLVYLLVILIYFLKKTPFHIRVNGLLLIVYLLGVALLVILGAIGAGWAWLFAFPVFASILRSFKISILAITLNAITLIVLGTLIHLGYLSSFLIGEYNLESWTVVSINFICLNCFVSIPIAVLLNALEVSMEEEEKTKLIITDQKETLKNRNKELLRINSDMDNFIYIASHDLKSPISNLQGLLSALENELEGKKDENIMQIIEMMQQSILKFRSVIDSLSMISQVQDPRLSQQNENLRLEDILEDVKFSLAALIKQFNPIIHKEFSVETISFPKKDITSILYNLLSNAIKYSATERRPEIKIKTYRKDNFVVLEIKDNGLGLKQEDQNKIFMMFKRMHNHVEGSGVGLYLVKRIIENHGGSIEVESQQGKGTTFRLNLINRE